MNIYLILIRFSHCYIYIYEKNRFTIRLPYFTGVYIPTESDQRQCTETETGKVWPKHCTITQVR